MLQPLAIKSSAHLVSIRHRLREQFFIGPLDDWAAHFQRFPGAAKVYAPNMWPARPTELREVFAAYYPAQERLACDLMRIFALALGLPEAWFDGAIDRHFSTCPTNLYPEPSGEPLPGQLRTGPHTDFGSLTILAVNDAPGFRCCFPTAPGATCGPRASSSSTSAT